jgi:hypothetical protein
MFISEKAGYLQDWITQVWVKLTGRRLHPQMEQWLLGPTGDTRIIGAKFIQELAAKEKLQVKENSPNGGLLENIDALDLTPQEKQWLHPRVADFYERTSNYDFEIWSEWCGFFRPFGWLLSVIFSKRLQQLNIPLNPIDSARGIKSNIIQLVDPLTEKTKWTIWYRIIKSTGRVIYSGVYTTCDVPKASGKHLKVVFPLPNGNAVVIMRKEVLQDGSLKLISDGKKYGDNGFYFTLTNHRGQYWARFVSSMHEWISVYEDEVKILRADHVLQFYGFIFLKLHYKMTEKRAALYTNISESEK